MASATAAPTNNTRGLIRRITPISSFHSALSELGVGPRVTEKFTLPQLNQVPETCVEDSGLANGRRSESGIHPDPSRQPRSRAAVYERRFRLRGIHLRFAPA